MEFECGDSDSSNVKNCLKENIKFWSETLKANKAIVNVSSFLHTQCQNLLILIIINPL